MLIFLHIFVVYVFCCTYTLFFRKDRSRVYWLSVVKTKLRSHIEVIKDGNDELTVRGDVFQLS